MSYDDQIADKLRAVDYDLDRLTGAKRAEIFTMAAKCGIQLWYRGLVWPSRPADQYAGPATNVDCR